MANTSISFTSGDVSTYYAVRVPHLKQRGKRWRGACPIHRGKRDSFSVDPETGLWRCWSECGRGGDMITLEEALTAATWREAVAQIECIIGRSLLNRPANRAEQRAFAERRRAAAAVADEIVHWQAALVTELNARKIAALDADDDEALGRAAKLCNLLENG